MRIGVLVIGLVLGLGVAAGRAADSDGPPRQSRITSFTTTPGEALPPRPRARVDTAPLATPAPPPSMVVAAAPLVAERLIGRWTERDAAYCRDDQYVIEWLPDRLRLVLDGRAIDGGRVRYAPDGVTLKIERLSDAGEVDAYWRLVAVDADRVEWVETAELRGAALEVIARPDKLLVRCAPATEPAPGVLSRARRWWAALLERLWGAPAAGAASPPS
jgi:hypothetical protein